jgi:signal transduction histidine kinase
LFYSADATGVLLTASDELRAIFEAGDDDAVNGRFAVLHREALARLRQAEAPVTYACTAVVGGRARRFTAWHSCAAGVSGEPVFVGLYAETRGETGDGLGGPARALAEIPDPTKSALLGHVSHELRTPLNAIIGFAELSLLQVHGRLDGRYLSYLTDIRSAAAQLLHVVDNLLEAADQDDGDSWRVTSLPLSEIVGEAKSAVAPLAAARGIDLAGISLTNDCVVRCDAQRLQRILRQLIGNAIKFSTAPGSIGIDVSHPNGDTIAITVWDGGAGIAPECRGHLFEEFGTLSRDVASRPCDGLSLGLANARRLARQLGGDIVVDSAVGCGARFTVTLPAGSAESPRPA